ncbi:FAD-dependent oxidoreductase [Chitinophagaceae bacterium LB-8]|uniref:FAD-dependent oxidoreductase n=1 Tax=Paraflavisolibacter caeni TaxID=2982496 RepID=A0A9X2XZZ2_9BACT|nr:FAD-dependent oxidoreductase [Paraflavisolibacter caeni]MCU7550593.1 FAD-dependent oxidoreductase [Paraflavisolibacter caeni]
MKYIIVGAVAGGASTAARLRRLDENAEIVIFEKGAYISYANCGLPYYIGDIIQDRNKLFVQTAANFNKRFNVDVRIMTEVININPSKKTITARNQQTGEIFDEGYDKLVLAPGAEPVRPPLPGIGLEGIFTLRNVTDTDFIKSYVQKYASGKAVVIGAGFIGLEMAENLQHSGLNVSIIEMGKQVLAPIDFPLAALVQQHIRSKGVDLRLNTSVNGFKKEDSGIKVLLSNGEELYTNIVILSIGVKPDTKLAANAGLKLGPAKGILVNEYLQTSDPDIYAVGDAIEFLNPITGLSSNTYLAGPANKQGRICANNLVMGNVQQYNGSINTAIVKVFDMTVATAGVPVKQLKNNNIEYIASTTHSGSHAGYFPGATQMSIQLAFAPKSGRLLSAQVAGYNGVDKRMDILASVIQRGGSIYELTELEHAYAPPFSSAKDPVNIAGFVAENILQEQMNVVYWDEFKEKATDAFILDVRTHKEFEAGSIEGATNIPLDELRSRLEELPKGKAIYIYCQVGLRGYLAYRILKQKGFVDIYNLSGGYKLWNACAAEHQINAPKIKAFV